jgi:hypothetical protein
MSMEPSNYNLIDSLRGRKVAKQDFSLLITQEGKLGLPTNQLCEANGGDPS